MSRWFSTDSIPISALSKVARARVLLSSLLCVIVTTAAVTAFAQSSPSFDHDLTRFPLTGKHENVRCESCHLDGQFAGTPTRCDSCHASAGARAETLPSVAHIPIQTGCNDCHTTRFWEPARMDHSFVSDNCQSCHFGSTATAKPPDHIQSSNRCADCHGTRRWEGARFDHDSVTSNCFSCHNGSTATGKDPDHIVTGNDCELCHSTRAWRPANFDHSSITTNCFSCHNGQITTGKDSGHVQSSNDCEVCHSTNAWRPAGFDHSGVAPGSCNSCHNGITAEGTPSGHFSSPLSCDRCHGTQNWLPADFDHAGVSYPGDHRVNLDCVDCHGGNNQIVTWRAPAYQPDCAGCHANDYEQDEDDHNDRSVSENRNCGAAGCHSVRDREW